jgi:plastocyanin
MRKIVVLALVTGVVVATAIAVPALGAGSHKIKVGDNFFIKDGGRPSITVSKGTTMKFIWRGHAPHNVVATRGPAKFRSGVKSRGEFDKRVTRAGTYTLVCTIHGARDMSMTLKVR